MELIKQFGNIEGLIKNVSKIPQEKRKKIIQESIKDIRISLELVKLDKKVKLPLNIDQIKPYIEIKNNKEQINKFLSDQDFKTIIKRLENNSFINKSSEKEI